MNFLCYLSGSPEFETSIIPIAKIIISLIEVWKNSRVVYVFDQGREYRLLRYIPDPGQKRKQLWNFIVILECIRNDNSRYSSVWQIDSIPIHR